jgi:hypothetical protein
MAESQQDPVTSAPEAQTAPIEGNMSIDETPAADEVRPQTRPS